ncbi:MAG: thiol:disulfide oxidoreductase [Acidocella sp. 21-58-7]|nr:MAG: thiol:disulfide oxidoreductase [Acidocella sp. 21-58-7]
MIELSYWTTPNGHKITIFLEEAGLPYQVKPINISKGAQFAPEFLKIAPNNRIPAIVDTAPADGGAPISVFESGAILQYLAEKTGMFLPSDVRGRTEVMAWLFKETNRLYGVLNKRLVDRAYIAGDYSIADMACYPWIVPYERQQQNIDEFPHLKRWFTAMAQRPAVARAYQIAKDINDNPTVTPESRVHLFGQVAQ